MARFVRPRARLTSLHAAVDRVQALLGIDLRRFVLICAPAILAIAVMVPGFFVGYMPAAFATVEPIGIGTSSGSSASMDLTAGANPVINVRDGKLDDLCLIPRISVLPFLPSVLSIRLTSDSRVSLGSITFSASTTAARGLGLPATSVGGSGGRDDDSTGPVSIHTTATDQRVRFDHLATDAYALRLEHGLSLTSLRAGVGFGRLTCEPVTGTSAVEEDQGS
ncbi:MAG: hypothetical protein QM572_13055 [Nocardioides sp.]|uniref:hypothetical protein n=1 Tax=Nocardioides sp. TaxID=35761 RepID=UPI0039E3D86B